MTTGRRSHRGRDLAAVVAVGVGLLVVWQLVVWLGDYQPFVLPGPRCRGRALAPRGAPRAPSPTTSRPRSRRSCWGSRWASRRGSWSASCSPARRSPSGCSRPTSWPPRPPRSWPSRRCIVIWFGNGLLSKVLICALICFFPMAVATTVGLRSVDARLRGDGRSSVRATPPPGRAHRRGARGAAPDPGRPQGRRHALGRGRHRGRVGGRRQGPGRAHQPRARQPVRHARCCSRPS